ncbi:MAG: hypothetical protein ACYSOO_06475 [Planctomycetota bacterium]|jgi:hypothetical protein
MKKKYLVMQIGQETSALPVKLGEHENYRAAVKLAACCQLALGMDVSVYIEEAFEGQDGPIPNRFKLNMNPFNGGGKWQKQRSSSTLKRRLSKKHQS